MKTKKCLLCKTRVKQHTWKTEFENNHCLKCENITTMCRSVEQAIESQYDRKILIHWRYETR